MTRTIFTNEKRPAGGTTEGHGEHRTFWPNFEVLCPCGTWTSDYGNASRQVGEDTNVQEWLCPGCTAESDAEWERQQADEAMLV